MIYIVSGTNRPQSRTLVIAKLVEKIFAEQKIPASLIDLQKLSTHQLDGTSYESSDASPIKVELEKVLQSRGLYFVCPEYNGSYPGILKYFIDHWPYPAAFDSRPVCFVGLGGRFAGVRPVEHLQQIFTYRNSFLYPQRVFLPNIWTLLSENSSELADKKYHDMLTAQISGFHQFIQALESKKLDARSKSLGS